MMNSIVKKLNWTVLFPAGILLFFLFAASPLFAAYSGHVASFKSEENAIKFVGRMKAIGLVAFYNREDVPGKGEFYRSYIGKYKTKLQARNVFAKLKKAGVIDYFQIQKMAEEDGEIVARKMETGEQKSKTVQQQPAESKETVAPAASGSPDAEMINKADAGMKKSPTLKQDLTSMGYFNLGMENIAQGQYEAALDNLGKAIIRNDGFGAAYNKRCFVLYMMGNADSAIKDCTMAITLKPDFVEAYYNRGLANHAANQTEAAIADYGKAIGIDGNYEAAYVQRGYLYYLSRRNEQAINDYTTAIGIKADDSEAYFNRALVYHDYGRIDKAMTDLQKACLLKNEQACLIAEDMSGK